MCSGIHCPEGHQWSRDKGECVKCEEGYYCSISILLFINISLDENNSIPCNNSSFYCPEGSSIPNSVKQCEEGIQNEKGLYVGVKNICQHPTTSEPTTSECKNKTIGADCSYCNFEGINLYLIFL